VVENINFQKRARAPACVRDCAATRAPSVHLGRRNFEIPARARVCVSRTPHARALSEAHKCTLMFYARTTCTCKDVAMGSTCQSLLARMIASSPVTYILPHDEGDQVRRREHAVMPHLNRPMDMCLGRKPHKSSDISMMSPAPRGILFLIRETRRR